MSCSPSPCACTCQRCEKILSMHWCIHSSWNVVEFFSKWCKNWIEHYRYRDLFSLLWDLECDNYVSTIIPSALFILSHSIYSHNGLYFQTRCSGAVWEADGALQHSTRDEQRNLWKIYFYLLFIPLLLPLQVPVTVYQSFLFEVNKNYNKEDSAFHVSKKPKCSMSSILKTFPCQLQLYLRLLLKVLTLEAPSKTTNYLFPHRNCHITRNYTQNLQYSCLYRLLLPYLEANTLERTH